MSLTKNPGRFAGLLYLLGSIPGWFALEYVPSKLLVDGNATATANPRTGLSPRHRGQPHLPDPFYLRGFGSVQPAQGREPAARRGNGDTVSSLGPDSISE